MNIPDVSRYVDPLDDLDRELGIGPYRELGPAVTRWIEHGEALAEPVDGRARTVPRSRGNGRAPANATQLPGELWTARPMLAHIRQGAHARGVSAEAVLGVVLARVVAASQHTIEIPPIVVAPCGLSLFVALVAPPGASKSGAFRTGSALVSPGALDPACDGQAPGSGEGLIEQLFDMVTEADPRDPDRKIKVKRQTRFNAFMYADEAETVLRQANRQSGSTILPHLRSIFTSGSLGAANASEENRRHLDAGSYIYGIVFGLQPSKAGPLFDDAGGGTPQRFLWCSAATPIPPLDEWPEEPGPLDWSPPDGVTLEAHKILRDVRFRHPVSIDSGVAREVAENYMYRREHGCNPLDEHNDLVRLKVAAALALLERRLDVSTEDWHLAGMIVEMSRAVRADVLATLAAEGHQREQTRRERDAGREIHKVDALHGHRVIECAQLIGRNVHTDADWCRSPSELYRRLRRWRDVLHEALEHAKAERWVEIVEEPSHTDQPKRTVQPGSQRPPA